MENGWDNTKRDADDTGFVKKKNSKIILKIVIIIMII